MLPRDGCDAFHCMCVQSSKSVTATLFFLLLLLTFLVYVLLNISLNIEKSNDAGSYENEFSLLFVHPGFINPDFKLNISLL